MGSVTCKSITMVTAEPVGAQGFGQAKLKTDQSLCDSTLSLSSFLKLTTILKCRQPGTVYWRVNKHICSFALWAVNFSQEAPCGEVKAPDLGRHQQALMATSRKLL